MRWFKLGAAAFLVGFLIGFGPMYMKVQEVRENAQVRQSTLEKNVEDLSSWLKMSELHSELGMLLLEVEDKNFGNAKARSTEFFNQLKAVADSQQGTEVGNRLEAVQQSRDEITAGLATADPETESKLRKLFVELATSAGVD